MTDAENSQVQMVAPPNPEMAQTAPAMQPVAGQQMMQQQQVTTTTTTQQVVVQGPDPYSGYNTGLTQTMFVTTTTTTTTTIVQQFGFSTTYQYPQVNPAYLQANQQYMLGYADPGTYEGPFDENGQRCGVGKCTWADGSWYEGEWKNNVRDGNGKYVCEEYEYAGQWVQDMRHGRCKYTRKDKKPVFGTFANDKPNGLAVCDGKTVLFKDGMLVVLSGDELTCCKVYRTVSQIILCLGIIILVGMGLVMQSQGNPDGGNFVGLAVVCYIANSVVACTNEACRYLCNTLGIVQLFKDVELGIAAPPICKHHIECYHYETTRDKNGNTQRRKVVTSTHDQDFNFDEWVDQSPPASTIDYLEHLLLSRLNIAEIVNYSPVARHRLNQERADFIQRYRNYDEEHTYSYFTDIPHTKEFTLVYNDKKGAKPWYANFALVIVLDIIMLGWYQRYFLEKNTFEVKYKLVKYIIR